MEYGMKVKKRTLSGKVIEVDTTDQPSPFELAILNALQSMRVYGGTVPRHVIARNRKRNRAARLSRRLNRAAS